MAIIDPNIANMINIRNFLATNLQSSDTVSKTLKITLNGELKTAYNVNVIWDGGEYYISFSAENEITSENPLILNKLDAVLPIQIISTVSA